MDFQIWEPIYEHILADFGFDRSADKQARDVLARMTGGFDTSRLPVSDQTVAIAGAGPSLADEADAATTADTVIAASSAAETLLADGIDVDCMVTDLDKCPETARQLTERGVPVAVHAHGDNIPAVRKWVPEFKRTNVLPTTQTQPAGPVRNFGGFTDGDRAAFLADHLNAARLAFVGWDFDDPSVNAMKRQKLDWAERLLFWLETRRGEQFPVLDGRRSDIDAIHDQSM